VDSVLVDEKVGEKMVVVEASLYLNTQIKCPFKYSSDQYSSHSTFNIPSPLGRSKWPVYDAEQAFYIQEDFSAKIMINSPTIRVPLL
jgi:hypothetical protein